MSETSTVPSTITTADLQKAALANDIMELTNALERLDEIELALDSPLF